MTVNILPRDITVDLSVGGYWTDIAGYVFQEDGLTITRGRGEGASQMAPSSCSLTLDNRDGRFFRGYPMGPYYGLFGRNTPLRVAVRTVTDSLGRTVSSGWGSSTPVLDWGNSYPWSTAGAGGSVLASDFNVAAGVGTMSVPATSAHRRVYLAAPTMRDGGVVASLTLPFTNVTGGPVEYDISLRGITSPSVDYYQARVTVEADETIKIALMRLLGGTIVAAATVPGLTHTSAQAIRLRAECEGQTLRARVWQPGLTGEPEAWHVTAHDTNLLAAGQPGIRVGVSSTNSNTLPVVFSIDNIEAYVPRFTGEVAEWPAERSNPFDARTSIEAAGVTRRLGQGSPPEDSILYRAITTQTNAPVAYWPCEDGANATTFASGIGGPDMSFTGVPELATNTDFVASNPLPELGTASTSGVVPFYTAGTETQVRLLLGIPDAGATDGARIIVFETTGSVRFWGLYYVAGGSGGLKFTANAATGPEVLASGTLGFAVNGALNRLSIELTQSGADVSWGISSIIPGGAAGAVGPFTLAGHTVGRVTGVYVGPNGGIALPAATPFGHITVQADIDSIFTLDDELAAYAGEAAGNRISRLAGEAAVTFTWSGTSLAATPMGPQKPGGALSVIQSGEYANQGFLSETRGDLALVYVMRADLYNRAAALTLDYAAGDLTRLFKAVDDDRHTANDVTARRVDGSSARVTIDTGPMSIQAPPNGINPYPDAPPAVNVQTDALLPDWAGWRALLGTVEESRYPQLYLNLASPSVGDRAMDLDIGDRITIDNATEAFVYDQISQLVLGYTEALSTFEHRLTVNCTPELPYQIAEANLAGVKADSDTSTLNAGVNSSATSLSVAVTGTLWTTSAGQMPISIKIGGEVMSVTAISGASSPQTFTVTRSVNGVTKSHAAAAPVRLTRRPTVAR